MDTKYLKRFNKSIEILEKKCGDDFAIIGKCDDRVHVIIRGPDNSSYYNHNIEVCIKPNESYPFTPPDIHFITPMWHPNICDFSGLLGKCPIDENWRIEIEDLVTIVKGLRHLLVNPIEKNAVNHVALKQYITNREQYWQAVKLLSTLTTDEDVYEFKIAVIATVFQTTTESIDAFEEKVFEHFE